MEETATLTDLLKELKEIKKRIDLLNAKIDNFLGFEELSEEELEKLDEIEAEMEKGEKYMLDGKVYFYS